MLDDFRSRSVICDLDGVVYRGGEAVPGSTEALQRLRQSEVRIVFATNNSSRTAEQVGDKIQKLTRLEFTADDIVTSSEAAMRLIPDEVNTCMVLGGAGLREAVVRSGREIVSARPDAECVLVGIDESIDYPSIAMAATAVRNGAVFVASNVDPTFPTSTGLLPGAGAIVAAVSVASGVDPLVAGKPEEPMRDVIRERGIEEAWVIGDRIDTDIEMAAREPGWRSILVLSGVTGMGEDNGLADRVVENLSEAVDLVLRADDRQ